jgi:hypothetical protein
MGDRQGGAHRAARAAGFAATASLALALSGGPATARHHQTDTAPTGGAPDAVLTLAAAPRVEQQTLQRLVCGESWPRRALAAMRLERFGCEESRRMLESLLADGSWQVRAFAIRTLGRRRLPVIPGTLDREDEPLVLRAALRYRYTVDPERLARGVRYLGRSDDLRDKVLAAELGTASGDEDLIELANEAGRKVILRMGRADAGALSPRLAALTGQTGLRRPHDWQQWLRDAGRRFALRPAYGVPASPDQPLPSGPLAGLDPQQFAALEGYIEVLSRRFLDLVICMDSTASMHQELAEAQGGIDDLMVFAGDVLGGVRIAIVAYRDQRDEFEVRAWDFTSDVQEARARLWSLSASGGGDRPESVYAALRIALSRLTWDPRHARTLVLVGDAPPHPGEGAPSIDLVRSAAAGGLTTHSIQAEARPVKHFPEIAAAGGGRCVTLGDQTDSLILEIVGLTLGERFEAEMRDFFTAYRELCR